ncbi:MAG: hypothetical protein M1814_006697 [Vezdaea aestivalis]|nr:MAG: hypothetical protein M1814_006697 [Vezdaea aestivalis]
MTEARIFYEKDASLDTLSGKTIVFIGYGNQGRAQALNIRDTFQIASLQNPPRTLVANPPDSYFKRALEDGFEATTDWAHAASVADVLFLLVPDQVQPRLFNETLKPTLKKGCTIVIASGYNVFYKYLAVSDTDDIVMVAPRMIGAGVRSRFESKEGFPCFVSVEQNSTGKAWSVTLALAAAIGALKSGAIESSAREETLMDLFTEQALWPSIIATFQQAYSTLKDLGCSDEALTHELWLSKEPAEVFEKCAEDGFVKQLVHHSTVSQYGQLKGSMEFDTTALRRNFSIIAEDRILGGEFAAEFGGLDKEDENGVQKRLSELYALASETELAKGEKRVRARMHMSPV